MIVVSVGASQFPFDRLLRAIDALSLEHDEPLVVQFGPSVIRPRRAQCVAYVPVQQLAGLIQEARVVVSHAGVGSILLSLANGKRPYVVPRRSGFGETVDDHQVESARRFAQADLVTLVEEPSELAEAIVEPSAVIESGLRGEGRLVHDLRDYLADVVGPPPPVVR